MNAVQVISKRTRFFQLVHPFLEEAGIEIISVNENNEEAINSFRLLSSSVVLLDANLIASQGIYSTPQLITLLRKINPLVNIILFTNTKEEFILNQMKQYKINGYVWLTMDNFISNLLSCVYTVLQTA